MQQSSDASKRWLARGAFAAWIAALLSVGMPDAQAKQCSAAAPSKPQGQWWSYRLIDGRKCVIERQPRVVTRAARGAAMRTLRRALERQHYAQDAGWIHDVHVL